MALKPPLDIHWAIVQVRTSKDQRPCIVLEAMPDGKLLVAPLSSQLDLFDPRLHFMLDVSDPDFKATGLKKQGFVLGDYIRDVHPDELGRYLGRLDGKLAERFISWLG